MRPTPSHSFRSIVLLLALGALAMAATAFLSRSTAAPAPAEQAPPVPLDEAVERTLAAGTARLDGELTARGARLAVQGVTSLTTADGDLTFEIDDGRVGPIGLRTIDNRDWIQIRGQWIDARDLPEAGDLPGGWGDYVRGLTAAGPATDDPRRAELHGAPAQVWVDEHGRVARVIVTLDGDRFDLRFSDFGVALDLEPPIAS